MVAYVGGEGKVVAKGLAFEGGLNVLPLFQM